MTENDTPRSPAPRAAGSPEDGTARTVSLPRRRDVRRSDAARRRTDTRRTALPATLTAVALAAGLATGAAATASGSPDTAPAPSKATAPATSAPESPAPSASGGTATTSREVSSAQAALARARTVANDSVGLSDEQRDKIARKADRLRALVTGPTSASQDDATSASSTAAAGAKASRSSERIPVADRARAETDGAAKAEKAEKAAKADAPTGSDEGDALQAGTSVAAEVAVGDAITHPTLLTDAGTALTGPDRTAGTSTPGTGTTGATATGSGAGGGKLAASPTSSKKLASATESLTTLIDRAKKSPVEIEAAPATPAEILTAKVQAARKAAPGLAKHADDTRAYENGRIPTSDLAELSFSSGETLRRDAAEQLELLNSAYRAQFGTNLQIRDSYRSYESQVSVKASRGYLAAVPGYSDHGWAVAVDLNGGVEEFGSAQYAWLRDVAPKFGWDNPGWARADGRKPEAWHWEYSAR